MNLPSSPNTSPMPNALALATQLAVVREMISTLDTLTAAGQQHVMSKVAGFLRDRVAGLMGIGSRNQSSASELTGQLSRECGRILPDVRRFSDRTEALLALLAAVH